MGRPKKPDGERARDIPPTGIRIPQELRAALEREAQINGRTLSGEILQRLRLSLSGEQARAEQRPSEGTPAGQAPREAAPGKPLTDSQRMMLALFEQQPPDKQLAWLTVMKR